MEKVTYYLPKENEEIKVKFDRYEYNEQWRRHYAFFSVIDNPELVARVSSRVKREYDSSKEYTLISKTFTPRGQSRTITYAAIKEDEKNI